MTALTAAAGFLAYLFPHHRKVLTVVALIFLEVAIYSGWKAAQVKCPQNIKALTAVAIVVSVIIVIVIGFCWKAVRVQGRYSGPLIFLCGLDAFHVESVPWHSSSGESWMTCDLRVRVVNHPIDRTETGIAKSFGLIFTCVGPGISLPWINARNLNSPQPRPNEPMQHRFDLPIDEWMEFGLVIKESRLDDCYMFNNDSYNDPRQRAQKPEWKIGPGEYRVVVRPMGVSEKLQEFGCTFINPGRGGLLKVKSFTPPPIVWPPVDPPATRAFWQFRRT